jgi:hypothetical protein
VTRRRVSGPLARGSRVRAWCFLAAFAACGGEPAKPSAPPQALEGALARAGGFGIPASLVASIAGARGLEPRPALDALIDDALAARGALDRHLDADPVVALASDVALARRIPMRAADDARSEGPPTADELQRVTVVHGLVARAPGESEENALAVAANIVRAVAGARSGDDFLARVRALPWQHVRVVAERVGPFGIDGRMPDGALLDKTFVATAFALHTPLQTSGIVATPFGWHVIQLVSREREAELSTERRQALAAAAIENRARTLVLDVLRARRERTTVEISHDAESLMALASGDAP